MDLHLRGKRVLITGASMGIGEGLARGFAEEGCHLHLVARSADRLEAIKREIEQEHSVDVTIQALDLAHVQAADKVAEAAGPTDILVNNAGAIPSGTLWDVDGEKWREGWELKVFGYIDMTRKLYPLMKERGGGVIINNIGNGGEVFDPKYIAGVSGNASLMSFTRAMGANSLADGIRVLGVNPGPVNTDRIHKMLRQRANDPSGAGPAYVELLKSYPLGRPAHVREVADMIIFLASDRSNYTSGTIITIDGGIASRRTIV